VNSPSQTPSMVPGLNVAEGFSGVGATLPARRLHRSHSQSHSELMRICGETEDGTMGDMGSRASAPVKRWGARLRKESTAGAVSGSGENDEYSAYAGGKALRPSLWFGTKSTQAGRHTGYCAAHIVPRPKKKGVSGTEQKLVLSKKRNGERKKDDGLRKDMDDQIESSFFFPFAEVERRDGRMTISTSGIHQKDPHVSGVTKYGKGAEKRRRGWDGQDRRRTGESVYMDGGDERALHYAALVPKFHIWQEKTSRPMDKPNDWKRRRRKITQAPSATPSSEPSPRPRPPRRRRRH
jgi:hypothetical protein